MCRFVAVFVALPAQWPAWSQSLIPAWHAGIAKVTVRADLYSKPGAAFVVAMEDGKAYLVTSAHVVEGDPNPQIEFVAAPRKPYRCTVQHPQARVAFRLHGLAILMVDNPPTGLSVLPPSNSPRPVQGDSVIVAGYPAPIEEFTVTDTTVGAFKGGDLVLNYETGHGYSGGPVLRNGSVVGLVFGAEGRFGLAVSSLQVQNYLQEYDLSWGSKNERPAKPVLSAERKGGEVRTNPSDGQPYVWIPSGEFQMGCSDKECDDDEKPPHKVIITRGFWLGQTEVTQAAYEKIIGSNPSKFKSPDRPVESVTWDAARKYCEAGGGRLPTEAEWEYAARAGSKESRYGELSAIAWYASNSDDQSQPVRKKEKNSWGLYDMLGNVWEWVADWSKKDYYTTLPSPAVDPKGPAPGTERVLRGGSWTDEILRASERGSGHPDVSIASLGFRCAREELP